MARTRVPTPHGPVFLHLYHNNHDSKEHLAIVVDPAQFLEPSPQLAPPIRSHSLDAVWSEDETEMDRITRGAYVGRLSAASQRPSAPVSTGRQQTRSDEASGPVARDVSGAGAGRRTPALLQSTAALSSTPSKVEITGSSLSGRE